MMVWNCHVHLTLFYKKSGNSYDTTYMAEHENLFDKISEDRQFYLKLTLRCKCKEHKRNTRVCSYAVLFEKKKNCRSCLWIMQIKNEYKCNSKYCNRTCCTNNVQCLCNTVILALVIPIINRLIEKSINRTLNNRLLPDFSRAD
jgi:hypothetical protein